MNKKSANVNENNCNCSFDFHRHSIFSQIENNTTRTKSYTTFIINSDMMDYEQAGTEQLPHMELSAASTTIDASVVQSRIRQSASIQKEIAMEDGDQPVFPKLSAAQASGNKIEYRRVRCPPHRYTPLREHWEQILTPLVEYLKLQVSAKRTFIALEKRKHLQRKK